MYYSYYMYSVIYRGYSNVSVEYDFYFMSELQKVMQYVAYFCVFLSDRGNVFNF